MAPDHAATLAASIEKAKAIATRFKRPASPALDDKTTSKTETEGPVQKKSRLAAAAAQVHVPRRSIGRVIGKQGSHLKKIQRLSGCHVQVAPDAGDATRVVTLEGEDDQVQLARDMIEQVVLDHAHGATRDVHDDCLTMTVPRQRVGDLIGDEGRTIYRIETRTRTKIVVHQGQGDKTSHSSVSGNQAPIGRVSLSISGKVAAVQAAKAAIDALVQGKKEPKR
ncbi:KH domain-containing protein [Gongronella butleri]|nr:KH domain-containing protein [Gongronella butleri]